MSNVIHMGDSIRRPASYQANPQAHRDIDPKRVVQYSFNVLQWYAHETDPKMTALDVIEKCYMFDSRNMPGFSVDEDGTLHYPDDPALIPLIKVERYTETIWLYQSDILAIVGPNELHVTRVD